MTYAVSKSLCLNGLEEFLSETKSADQLGKVFPPEPRAEQVYSSATPLPDAWPADGSTAASIPNLLNEFEHVEDDSFEEIVRKWNLEAYDKRDRGGCFWVVGGHELDPLMEGLARRGIWFSFTPNGSKTTRRRPAWYLK